MPNTRTTGYAFIFVLAFASSVAAQNIVVKNDSLPDDYSGSATWQVYFAAGEDAQVWLTSPVCGTIVAVELVWGSVLASPGPFIESEIGFFEPVVFPERSNTYLQQNGMDAKIVSPLLFGSQQDFSGTINTYTDIIPVPPATFPMAIPVDAGQTFVIALKFANTYTGQLTDPTILVDIDDCTADANAARVPSGDPCLDCDLCGLGHMTHDFVMRAIVQPYPIIEDTNCDGIVGIIDFLDILANWGPCPAPCAFDFDDDGIVGIIEFLAVLREWSS